MRHVQKIRSAWPVWAMAVVLMVLLVACGSNRESALSTSDEELMAATNQSDFDKLVAEGDALWGERVEEAKLTQAIAKWEEAAKAATPNRTAEERRLALAELYTKIARGHYLMADTHIRFAGGDDDVREDRMKATFNNGVTSAEKALALYSPKFAEAIRNNQDVEDSIPLLDKSAVPAMYWYAASIGKWASYVGFAEIVSRKDSIKMMMDRVYELDSAFFFGGPPRYLGAFFSRLPGFAGKDLDKSRQFFEESIKAAPGYLGTRVLMAQDLALQLEDKELFRTQLEFVVNYDLSQSPEIAAENTFEQRKAKKLLEDMDDLF
ncbi:MAG: TRAP transporter TatT component family protein [Myxococcota bacterium]